MLKLHKLGSCQRGALEKKPEEISYGPAGLSQVSATKLEALAAFPDVGLSMTSNFYFSLTVKI